MQALFVVVAQNYMRSLCLGIAENYVCVRFCYRQNLYAWAMCHYR